MSKVYEEEVRKAALSYGEVDSVREVSRYSSGAARESFWVQTDSGNFVVYMCGDTSEAYEERFSKEEELLEIVNSKTDIPTQKIILSDFSKDEVPYLFYIGEEIEGYDPIDRFKWLPRDEKKEIVYEAGKFLGELHREVRFDEAGELREQGGDIVSEGLSWERFLERWTDKYLSKFEDTAFEDLKEEARKFFDQHRELAEKGDNVCLHFDVTPDNLIIKNGEIEALIDWEKAIAGRPEWDLGYVRIQLIYRWFETEEIQKELENQLFRGYFEENELEDGWRKRLIYFNTIWNFRPIANLDDILEDATEEERKEEKEFFRQLLQRNFENLEEAVEQEFFY